jgi:hypothetical protein
VYGTVEMLEITTLSAAVITFLRRNDSGSLDRYHAPQRVIADNRAVPVRRVTRSSARYAHAAVNRLTEPQAVPITPLR